MSETLLNSRRIWNEEDLSYLYSHYETTSLNKLSKKLGRTPEAIKKKANEIGVTSHGCTQFSIKTIAKAFNSADSVPKRWIEKFGLKAKAVKRGQATYFYIDPNDFWIWAKEHATLIPWYKYTPNSLGVDPVWIEDQLEDSVELNHCLFDFDELQEIIKEYSRGESIRDIAKKHRRSIESIKHVLRENYVSEDIKTEFSPEMLVQNREKRGFTRDELAKQIGVTAETISKWERGIRCPRRQYFNKLRTFFWI